MSRPPVHALPVLVAALIALAVAGCGSSKSSSSSGTSAAGTPTATTQGKPAGSEINGEVLGELPVVPGPTTSTEHPSSPNGTGGDAFLRAVFDDVQAMWAREFAAAGEHYTPATMTIFRDEVDTACGTQPATVGPFYCPADHGVYLDSRFFDALSRQVGVHLGDFARAYVIGHEVGHHVQVLLGISQRVHAANQQDPAGENARSVRVELQADCLAGIWKHSAYHRDELTAADFEDALRAAAVVGDDFQQASATGTIRPETWTHGSSAQRRHWLTVGFEEGQPAACDTFGS
jgi:hypothetical protein